MRLKRKASTLIFQVISTHVHTLYCTQSSCVIFIFFIQNYFCRVEIIVTVASVSCVSVYCNGFDM